MKGKLEIRGLILDGGRLSKDNAEMIKCYLKEFQGEIVTIEFSKHKKRSNPQNRYYWGVLIPTIRNGINDLGNEFSTQETHEFLKAQFNKKEIEVNDGYYIDIPESTTKLDTVGFMEYIERCIRFAADMLNMVIPLPDEQLSLTFYQHDAEVNATIVEGEKITI